MGEISESSKKSNLVCNIAHLIFKMLSASGGFATWPPDQTPTIGSR